MLTVIIGTITIVAMSIITKIDENQRNREWKENEETDWNEYYANKH
jgi:hypothetical protein